MISLQSFQDDPKHDRRAILAGWLRAVGPENVNRIRKIGILRGSRKHGSLFSDRDGAAKLQLLLDEARLELAKETEIKTVTCES